MKIKYFITMFFLLSIILNATTIPSYLFKSDYTSIPVSISPLPGKYNKSLLISVDCKEGELYYYYGNELGKNEPILYTVPLHLSGDMGVLKEYSIYFTLILDNNRIFSFTANYTIDMIHFDDNIVSARDDFPIMNYKFKDDSIIVNALNSDSLSFEEARIINIPFTNINRNTELIIPIKPSLKSEYLVNSLPTFMKYTNILYEFLEVDMVKPIIPTLHTDVWGQIYNQDVKIHINNPNKSGTVFYWLKEWGVDDIIKGFPSINSAEYWNEYLKEILIEPNKEKDSVFGLATFVKSDNGISSDVSGPYFFKIKNDSTDDISIPPDFIEPVINNVIKSEKILINGQEIINKYSLLKSDILKITFPENFYSNNFLFNYSSLSYNGRSSAIPATGSYEFELKTDEIVELYLYDEFNNCFAAICVGKKIPEFPKPVAVFSNNIVFNNDAVIQYFIPIAKSKTKYTITNNDINYTELNKLLDFNGEIKFSKVNNGLVDYKIIFNSDGVNYTSPYIVSIDTIINENFDIVGMYDSEMIYNQPITLLLKQIDGVKEVYYRTNDDEKWILYEEKITLNPVESLLSSISLQFKLVNGSGEQILDKIYTYNFDTRAIFVDSETTILDSNGTEKYPIQSLHKAIQVAQNRNIKIINIKSSKAFLTRDVIISSDLIIQAYNPKENSVILFQNKSLLHQSGNWLTVKNNALFELRNISVEIKTGKNFIVSNQSRIGLYNLDIKNDNNTSMTIIETNKSRVSVVNCKINSTSESKNIFSFLNSFQSEIVIHKLNGEIKANSVDLIKAINNSSIIITDFAINSTADTLNRIFYLHNSSLNLDTGFLTLFSKKGGLYPFTFEKSIFSIKKNTLNTFAESCFDVRLFTINKSEGRMEMTQTFSSGANDTIGMNIRDSNVKLHRSLIDITANREFIYNIRAEKSELLMTSTVLRNAEGADYAVGVLLSDSIFQGGNNSFFSHNISGKTYNFWISSSKFTSINSLYHIDSKSNNSFVFLKDNDYSNFKPIWLSNIVSENILGIENINNASNELLMESFKGSNVAYNLSDTFDLSSKYYFIPNNNNQIGELGVTAINEYECIPEKDFFGYNITSFSDCTDIGAVQYVSDRKKR